MILGAGGYIGYRLTNKEEVPSSPVISAEKNTLDVEAPENPGLIFE